MNRWVAMWVLTASALLFVGCSDDPEKPGVSESAGGELPPDDADGMAKAMPAGQTSATTEAGEPRADDGVEQVSHAPSGNSYRLPDAPAVPKPKAGAVSKWAAADAPSGKPLPARKSMKAGARGPYRAGIKAAQRGDNKKARVQFEKAHAADPKSHAVLYNLGVMADRQGRANQAIEFYGRALKLQPDYEEAVQGTVNIHIRRGDLSRAQAVARKRADQWERNLYLQAIVADVLTRSDRIDEAESRARAALKRDERFVPAMVSLAKASLRRGRLELAESILAQARAIDARHAEVHFLQGQAFQRTNRLDVALNSYRKAVEEQPDYAEARMALGIQYMASGNYKEALTQFEMAVRLVPTLVPAHLNLGDAYRANKEWKKAKQEFDRALNMQDDLPEAHFNLALMYMSAEDQFPGLDKLASLDRAILEFNNYRNKMGSRLRPDDPSATYITDLQRTVDREKKRLEREARNKAKEKERAARKAKMEADQ